MKCESCGKDYWFKTAFRTPTLCSACYWSLPLKQQREILRAFPVPPWQHGYDPDHRAASPRIRLWSGKPFPAGRLFALAALLALLGPAISHEGELVWGMFGVQMVGNLFTGFPLFPVIYIIYVVAAFAVLSVALGLYRLGSAVARPRVSPRETAARGNKDAA